MWRVCCCSAGTMLPVGSHPLKIRLVLVILFVLPHMQDIEMPNLDGLHATQLIRQAELPDRRTPVVGYTAAVSHDDHMRCLAAGMDEVLSKPCRFAGMESLARKYCRVTASGPEAVAGTCLQATAEATGEVSSARTKPTSPRPRA